MSTTITHPTAETSVKYGIQFTDGVAVVNYSLEQEVLTVLLADGATVEVLAEAIPEVEGLDDMTIAQLNTFAAEQNPPIEVASGLRRSDLLAAIKAEVLARNGGAAEVIRTDGTPVPVGDDGIPVLSDGEPQGEPTNQDTPEGEAV